MAVMEFKPFPKLARLNREIVITEKIDGTNAQVYIVQSLAPEEGAIAHKSLGTAGDLSMFAGSRTKWITPGKQSDNAGFAAWVKENAEELFKLGPGQHFGEWWGGKIQRGYGLTEKRFSLFNTGRWVDRHFIVSINGDQLVNHTARVPAEGQQYAPTCCHVVPVLYKGPFDETAIGGALFDLEVSGSVAAPGFMKPEGIVIYHTAANSMFKVTLENDESPKSLVA
jgi:hypothetical protein